MKRLLLLAFILLFAQVLFAGNKNEEFRATWVITWNLIDSDLSTWRNEVLDRTIIENHAKANMNALLWQVRQGGTAYYNSSYEPWGYYAGYHDPGYDPLAYAIREAHKRGMEVHAWFNTFDASSTHDGAPSHEHPEWVCRDRDGNPMTSHRSISPGLPEVRAYLVKVAMEIVRKYDIDGIHLDYVRWNEYTNSTRSMKFAKMFSENRMLDGMITQEQIDELNSNQAGRYLYDVEHPYSAGVPSGFSSWEDWWRWSVTEFVRTLHDSIQSVKPWVRLSAAVLGKYNWSGWQAYGTVYQDAALWFNKGYVDQLTPMHYHWLTPDGFYGMLVGDCPNCWYQYIQPGIQAGRLYTVGPGSYILADNNAWNNHPAIVEKVRTIPWVDGFQFFSYGSWRDYNYWDDARKLFFQNKTKVRATALIDSIPPDPPTITLTKVDSMNYQITVYPPASIAAKQRFAVYRSEDDVLDVNSDPIVGLRFGMDTVSVADHITGLQDFNGRYRYFATTLDRYWNESTPSNVELSNPAPSFPPQVVSTVPVDGDSIPITQSIQLSFSKTMDTLSFRQGIQFDPSVGEITLQWSSDLKNVTISPKNLFQMGTHYTFTLTPTITDVNGKSIDGNGDGQPGDAYQLHFKTFNKDIYPPQIVDSFPTKSPYQAQVDVETPLTVVFNEAIDPKSVSDTTVFLYKSGQEVVPIDYQLTSTNGQSVLSMKPYDELLPETVYTILVTTGVTDTSGNHLEKNLVVNFKTADYHYYQMESIDDFTFPGDWKQPGYSGSTVGIIASECDFGFTRSVYLPASASRPIQRRAAYLKYAWDTNQSEHLIREDLTGGTPKNVVFDTSFVLQVYLYGDGSGNKFRFCLREGNQTSWAGLEVSQWITINWVGWRLVEWKLSDPNNVGSWIGNGIMDGTRYRVDSFQLTTDENAAVSGLLYFDNLQIAKRTTAPVGIKENSQSIPIAFQLEQNYPNPFNPSTTIEYSVPKKSFVRLLIFNVMGKRVAELVNEVVEPGSHRVVFQGQDFASGIYYYRLIYDGGMLTRKMILTK